MYKYFSIIALFLVIGCTSKPNDSVSSETDVVNLQSAVDSAAKEMLSQPLINSTSIGIYYGGEEYIGHYGELEKGKQNKPTNETFYEIGSLSKAITGTMVAKAVLEGKISLEDSVNQYLDGKYPNLSYQNQPVRIKHLLTHTSTLPNMLPMEVNTILNNFLDHDTPSKINQVLSDYDKNKFLEDLYTIEISAELGTKYSYSTTGTELIAHILEVVYEKEYEKQLTHFLSEEVGMNTTKINLNDEELKILAIGYHVDNLESTLPMGKLPWGAGGNIKSTLPDMMQFIKYQLKDEEIVNESHKMLFKVDSINGLAYFWNIDLSDKNWGRYYLHHGGVPRSQCYLLVVPKHDLGVFIITNQSGNETANIMAQALEQIFDEILPKN